MRISRLIYVLLLVAILYGCTQVPIPSTYPVSKQYKIQAVHHWDILAEDVAKQIREVLIIKNITNKPVFVQSDCGSTKEPCSSHNGSPFGQAFHDLLITQLVNNNVAVVTDERYALILSSKVQVVYHRANRDLPKTGAWAFLTAEIFVIREAILYWNIPANIAAVSGSILAHSAIEDSTDSSIFSKKLPHSEIIVTTSIIKDKTYLMRKSDIYYINDADFWNYKASPSVNYIKVVD